MTMAVDVAMGMIVDVPMAVSVAAPVAARGVAMNMDVAVRFRGNMDVGLVLVSQRDAGDHPDRDSDRQCFVLAGPSRRDRQHSDKKRNQKEQPHPESPSHELPESIYGSKPAVYLDSASKI